MMELLSVAAQLAQPLVLLYCVVVLISMHMRTTRTLTEMTTIMAEIVKVMGKLVPTPPNGGTPVEDAPPSPGRDASDDLKKAA